MCVFRAGHPSWPLASGKTCSACIVEYLSLLLLLGSTGNTQNTWQVQHLLLSAHEDQGSYQGEGRQRLEAARGPQSVRLLVQAAGCARRHIGRLRQACTTPCNLMRWWHGASHP
jgi:hypothetical protein